MSETPLALDPLEGATEIIHEAQKVLAHLCQARWAGGEAWEKAWKWHIPAQEVDTDSRLGAAIMLAGRAVEEVRRLRALASSPPQARNVECRNPGGPLDKDVCDCPACLHEIAAAPPQAPTLDAESLKATADLWYEKGVKEGAAQWAHGLHIIKARACDALKFTMVENKLLRVYPALVRAYEIGRSRPPFAAGEQDFKAGFDAGAQFHAAHRAWDYVAANSAWVAYQNQPAAATYPSASFLGAIVPFYSGPVGGFEIEAGRLEGWLYLRRRGDEFWIKIGRDGAHG